ncbi:MAG: cbb3-type cytochrome c oxidase N-terminal domain-containing protein [Ferruginibacter sp.]
MRFSQKLICKSLFLSSMLFLSTQGYAQDANSTKTVTSSNNLAETFMIIIALLLAFVIWGMGQVLVALGRQALEKSKSQNNILSVILLLGFSLLSFTAGAQDAEKLNVVTNYGGMNGTGFWMLSIVIFIEIVLIAFLMFSIRRIQTELLPQKAKGKSFDFSSWWSTLDKRIFTKAVAVEKEADVLLDHDYDGIRELDNALPPWWKYGFVITIVVAVIYLFNFHVMGFGKNPIEEYQEEIAQAQVAKEEYDAKNKDRIDESNLKMPDASGIAAGKNIFTTACWACHGKQGEGGAGPNLTDDYWLHKGSLTDVYASIKHGYPDKGMQAWEKNYSPKEINNLAAFIKTLRGTNPPNQKAVQGDLFSEGISDSTISKPAAADSMNKSITSSFKH